MRVKWAFVRRNRRSFVPHLATSKPWAVLQWAICITLRSPSEIPHFGRLSCHGPFGPLESFKNQIRLLASIGIYGLSKGAKVDFFIDIFRLQIQWWQRKSMLSTSHCKSWWRGLCTKCLGQMRVKLKRPPFQAWICRLFDTLSKSRVCSILELVQYHIYVALNLQWTVEWFEAQKLNLKKQAKLCETLKWNVQPWMTMLTVGVSLQEIAVLSLAVSAVKTRTAQKLPQPSLTVNMLISETLQTNTV